MSLTGGRIVSVDPAYAFTADEIQKSIAETYDIILEQARKNRNEFLWITISSVEELGRLRMGAMEMFLKDFEKGKAQGRYQSGQLPKLFF